jgi:hypothetical protein
MQFRPSPQANVSNPLQALVEQLPDEEKDEARDRAHAAGNLAAAFLEVVRSHATERICRISMCAWLAKSIWT